ncbi:hypothetical protein GQ600_22889 [Phytophthora cactorum]|nr:hypothetical protein GQ600_22889 [Phytophthora cactorum]
MHQYFLTALDWKAAKPEREQPNMPGEQALQEGRAAPAEGGTKSCRDGPLVDNASEDEDPDYKTIGPAHRTIRGRHWTPGWASWVETRIKWYSLAGGGSMRREGVRISEPLCAATKQIGKSLSVEPLFGMTRTPEGMAIHARETIYVLDVDTNGTVRAQVYAYTSIHLSNDDSFDSGTVHPMQSSRALQLLQKLIGEGILPPVLVLRWQDTGNHFQAVTYDKERCDHYIRQLKTLAQRRNDVLVKNSWTRLDFIQYVRDFVKNWRRKNPKDSMAPLIALCDSRLYDQQDPVTLQDTEMVILCDSQPNSIPGIQDECHISEMAPHRIPCELE